MTESQQKREAWQEVEKLVSRAWYLLLTADESPMTQATLLDLKDRAEEQARLWS